jgi:hypothetical protein
VAIDFILLASRSKLILNLELSIGMHDFRNIPARLHFREHQCVAYKEDMFCRLPFSVLLWDALGFTLRVGVTV